MPRKERKRANGQLVCLVKEQQKEVVNDARAWRRAAPAEPSMLILILVLLLVFGGGGGYYLGNPGYDYRYGGGGIGLVLIIVLVLYLLGAIRL